MFQSSKPPIAQNRIPKVKDLHESLGFGPSFNRPITDLQDSTHHFRKEYLTSDGTPGRDLTDWKTSKTQNDLLRMTRTFLEDEYYGLKYWPSNESALSRRIPEYPKDSEKITELLKQLFWRQNMHGAHNAKHPDRGRQVRESVESDATLVNTSVNHPRFVDLFDQDSRSFPHKNRPTPSPQTETFNHGLRSPPYENAEDVLRHGNSFTSMHMKWDASSSTDRNASASRPKQPAPLGGTTRYIALPELDEDTTGHPDSDSETGQHAGTANKDFENTITDLEHDHIDDERMETPRSRGIAPKARMVAPPVEPTTIRIPAYPAQKTPPSKSKASTESKEAKRKNADDEDAEYMPSKKLKTQNVTSYIAITKPSRCRKNTEHDSSKSSASVSSVNSTAGPSSITSGFKNTSPVVIPEMTGNTANSVRTPPPHHRSSTVVQGTSATRTKISTPQKTPTLIEKLRAQKRLEKKISSTPAVEQPDEFSVRDPQESPIPTSGPSYQVEASQNHQASNTDAAALVQVAEARADKGQVSFDNTAQAASGIAQEAPAPHTSTPGIEIRYSIIASRTPRLVKRNWAIQSLSGMTIHKLFEEVAKAASKANVLRIDFRLNLSQADSEYTIRRDDAKTFEAMKDEFADDVMADWQENGHTKFSIWLEPDPVEQGSEAKDVGPVVESVNRDRQKIAI